MAPAVMYGGGGVAVRLWFLLLLASTILSSASRPTPFLAGKETAVDLEGRSLRISVNDYDVPSANRGHDPVRSGNEGRRGSRARDGRH